VLAPGGRIVLLDSDMDMWAIDSDDVPTTSAILAALAGTIASPWIGRRYRALLLDAGFTDVAIELRTAVVTDYPSVAEQMPGFASPAVRSGVLTQAQADAWLAEQARRGATNRFLRLVPMFLRLVPMFLASAHRA
jgi:hypothetical protein